MPTLGAGFENKSGMLIYFDARDIFSPLDLQTAEIHLGQVWIMSSLRSKQVISNKLSVGAVLETELGNGILMDLIYNAKRATLSYILLPFLSNGEKFSFAEMKSINSRQIRKINAATTIPASSLDNFDKQFSSFLTDKLHQSSSNNIGAVQRFMAIPWTRRAGILWDWIHLAIEQEEDENFRSYSLQVALFRRFFFGLLPGSWFSINQEDLDSRIQFGSIAATRVHLRNEEWRNKHPKSFSRKSFDFKIAKQDPDEVREWMVVKMEAQEKEDGEEKSVQTRGSSSAAAAASKPAFVSREISSQASASSSSVTSTARSASNIKKLKGKKQVTEKKRIIVDVEEDEEEIEEQLEKMKKKKNDEEAGRFPNFLLQEVEILRRERDELKEMVKDSVILKPDPSHQGRFIIGSTGEEVYFLIKKAHIMLFEAMGVHWSEETKDLGLFCQLSSKKSS